MQNYLYKYLKEEEKGADLFHIEGGDLWGAGKYKKLCGVVPVICYINGYMESMGIVTPNSQGLSYSKKMLIYIRDWLYRKKRLIFDKFMLFYYAKYVDAIKGNTSSLYTINGKKELEKFLREFTTI